MSVKVLNIKNLSVKIEKTIIDHMELQIGKGEIVGMIGASGCGKTTAIHAIMGCLPSSAEVRMDLEYMTAKKAMIFQDPMSYFDDRMKIQDQIKEVLLTNGIRENHKKKVQELLEMAGFQNPVAIMKKYPFELSGGMCQRAAFAMAMASEPELLIADEPTTGLDPITQNQILKTVVQVVKKRKMALLLVSHDLQLIQHICDRVIVLKDGKILSQGNKEKLFEEKGRVEGMDESENKETEYPILEICNMEKHYGMQEGVRNLSFHLLEGEMFGLVGESGSGKSTLAKLIAGVIRPDKGTINWKEEMDPKSVQMIFQDPLSALNPALTMGNMLHDALKSAGVKKKEVRDRRIEELLLKIGVGSELLKKYPSECSGGQRMRMMIARALVLQPKLLICDESVAGLDWEAQRKVLELLKQIQKEDKITCLFITHDLNVVESMCDRIGIMKDGYLLEVIDTKDPKMEHPYSKALFSATDELKQIGEGR